MDAGSWRPGIWIFFALLVAAAVWIWVAAVRRRRIVWRQFARRHGLRRGEGSSGGEPRVEGELEGRRFRLHVAQSSSDTGLLGVEEVVMALGLRVPLPEGLRVSRGGVVGEVTKAVEEDRPVPVDQEFDRSVLVRGKDPDRIRAWLTPARQAAFVQLFSVEKTCLAGLEDGKVFLREREMMSSLEQLERRVSLLRDVASRLDG